MPLIPDRRETEKRDGEAIETNIWLRNEDKKKKRGRRGKEKETRADVTRDQESYREV